MSASQLNESHLGIPSNRTPSHGPAVDVEDQAACGCSISQAGKALSKYNLEGYRYALANDINEECHRPRVEQGHLCKICIDMLSSFALSRGSDGLACGDHHRSKDSLLRSAKESCYICMGLSRALKDFDFSWMRWRVMSQEPMTAEHVSSYQVRFSVYQADGSGNAHIFFTVGRQGETTPLMRTAMRSRAQPSTWGQDAIDLVKMWLQLSIEGPTNNQGRTVSGVAIAGSLSDQSWFPTRVLDISGDKMRLIDSDRASVQSPYATLSYCWGTKSFLRLTSETNCQLRAGVEFESLPILFQQVILTTRNLGIHYLWIDCFCIIQGPSFEASRDWQVEATRMAQVYAHGLLNIAADESTTPFEPLFRRRARSDVEPCHFSWEPGFCPRGMYRIEDQETTAMTLVRAHLHTRGWTYQERLLCGRMLHFGAHQIAWEYGSGFWSETYPDGLRLSRPGGKFDIPQKIGTDVLYEKWTGAIFNYSMRSLTYPDKDKLMAVAAMAKRYAEASDWIGEAQNYAAGHMRSSLLFSLCWKIDERRTQRADIWRAPSWSWASIDGRLSFAVESFRWKDVMQDSLADVVDMKLDHELPGDVYGLLRSGHLHLTAKLLDCPVNVCLRRSTEWSADLGHFALSGIAFDLMLVVDDARDLPLDSSTALIMPLVFCHPRHDRRVDEKRNVYGLLIMSCGSLKGSVGTGNQYRRIGNVEMKYGHKGEDDSTRETDVEEIVRGGFRALPEHEVIIV